MTTKHAFGRGATTIRPGSSLGLCLIGKILRGGGLLTIRTRALLSASGLKSILLKAFSAGTEEENHDEAAA